MFRRLGRLRCTQVSVKRLVHYSTKQPADDEELLKAIAKEGKAEQGPDYWRRKYNRSVRKVDYGLKKKLEKQFRYSLPKVRSYNEPKVDPLEKLKVNLSDPNLTLSDLLNSTELVKAVRSYFGSDRPTEFQRRFLALATSGLSTIAKGDQGSGRSTAIMMAALGLRRNPNRGHGINSLVVVKTTEMVKQYERVIRQMISETQGGFSDKVAQFLHRSDNEVEQKQQSILARTPEPHVLVVTPQRLLDLLSTRGMEFLKLNSLSAIFVDDFDAMYETRQKAPVVQLLDYVVKLQDYRRRHNEPHPQLGFAVSNCVTSSMLTQIREDTKWIDWDRYAPIGMFGGDTDLPYQEGVPCNVGVSSVIVDPYMTGNKSKFKVKLYDMVPFQYGTDMSRWLDKVFRSIEGTDSTYKKQRNIKKGSMGKEVKQTAMEVLVSGFLKLTKKDPQLKFQKILMVYSDEMSELRLKDLLEKAKKSVKVYEDDEDLQGSEQILLINASSLTGLTFKGLHNIVLLGLDTIKGVEGLVSIGGRFRDETGLVSESLYTSFGDTTADPIQNRIFLLNSKLDFEDPERNFLERALIKAGLVRQFQSVGVTESGFDQVSYERRFASDYGTFFH